MFLEEKILKKMFDIKGKLSTGNKFEFEFETLYDGHVKIKLNGNKVELYSFVESDFYLEQEKELSREDAIALKEEGYKW